jgi:hypothetical protein
MLPGDISSCSPVPQPSAFEHQVPPSLKSAPKSPHPPETKEHRRSASIHDYPAYIQQLAHSSVRSFARVQISSPLFSCAHALFVKNTREGVGVSTTKISSRESTRAPRPMPKPEHQARQPEKKSRQCEKMLSSALVPGARMMNSPCTSNGGRRT